MSERVLSLSKRLSSCAYSFITAFWTCIAALLLGFFFYCWAMDSLGPIVFSRIRLSPILKISFKSISFDILPQDSRILIVSILFICKCCKIQVFFIFKTPSHIFSIITIVCNFFRSFSLSVFKRCRGNKATTKKVKHYVEKLFAHLIKKLAHLLNKKPLTK